MVRCKLWRGLASRHFFFRGEYKNHDQATAWRPVIFTEGGGDLIVGHSAVAKRFHSALKIVVVLILDVLVPRPATDGGAKTVGQHSGLVDLREWREVD